MKPQFKRAARPTVVLAIVAVVVAIAMLLRQESVYHVTVQPGGSALLAIETRLQRTFEHKNYVKGKNLPVTCRVTGQPPHPDGVTVQVIDTGHRLHHLQAQLQVRAAPDTQPGPRKRIADFTIDRQSGWPRVTVVVVVQD